MSYLTKNKFVIIGAILGGVGGYLYYHFIGCSSGTCAITSKPLNSSVYGAIVGGLLYSYIPTDKTKK
ncbi:MAG: DUF6132 family protein [Crocinitomicaceae bacterium]